MTNIKKASLVAIVILVLVIGICIASFAANTGTILKEAKLRKQASNDSIVLEIIPKKEEVEILAEDGDWYQVRYNKIKGYVQKDFLEVIKEDDNKEQEGNNDTKGNDKVKEIKKGATFKIENETKIYVRPLINSKVILNLEKDKTVNVIEIRNNWVYINIDDVSGWVSLKSIGATLSNTEGSNQTENSNKPEETNNNQIENNNQTENDNEANNNKSENNSNESNQKEELNKTAYIVTSGINFREEANTDSKVLKVFAQNAKVTILEETGDFYKIKHNDQTGYVLKTYVSSKKVETTSRSNVDRTSSIENKTETNIKEETKASTSNKGQEIANYVKQFVGYRYVYGGSTPKGGFDCSGLTMYVYKQFGVTLSHSATAQSKVGTKVSKSNLQPGDLVFFTNYKTGKGIGHVGIYIGNNQFVHASTEKTGVITSSMTSGSYSRRYVTATRMF